MPDIFITDIRFDRDASSAGECHVMFNTNVDGEASSWGFDVNISMSALAANINTAIKDAAVAGLATVDITVGVFDKKTLFGGAVGL